MGAYRIFIIEDDPWYGEILAYHLSLNPEYEVSRYTSAAECMANLHKKPQLLTLDYSLPDANGLELFKQIRSQYPDLPVIIISGQEEISTAVKLLKEGAYDYLVKDESTKELLWKAVLRARETDTLKEKVEHLQEELGKKYEFDKSIKGNSPAMQKVFALMEKAALANINVTVTGETGTGKELVAKAIHYNSERRKRPFVALNMAAIPAELVESELFGHEKGAFTGAIARKAGRFEEAHKGTLFLDEIAEMSLSVQSKLLRVLQERELVRVGGSEKINLDVRLIVATHKNLAAEVKEGRFREDLYYRIIGLPIDLPPLRERGNDILVLAKYFADEFCKDNKLPPLSISAEARQKLLKYPFPGNARELKAAIDLAVVMSDKKEITPADITLHTPASGNFLGSTDHSLKEYTVMIIKHYLGRYNNNVVKVAAILGIGKSTIYKMIQNKELVLEEN